MNIDEYKAKQAELDEYVRTHGKSMLLEGFKAIFEATPTLLGIRWVQYTPYFNDGDACIFGVNEGSYKFNDSTEIGDAAEDEDEDEDEDEEDRSGYRECPWRAPEDSPIAIVNAAFQALSGPLERVFEAAFGDHVEVIITRDLEVEIEEYDHD